MDTLDYKIGNFHIEVKAGPNGGKDEVYAWVNSPLPEWVKSVEDPRYKLYSSLALETAKRLAKETKENITFGMSIEIYEG